MLPISERTRQLFKALGRTENVNGGVLQHVRKPLKERNVTDFCPRYADLPWDHLETTLQRGYHVWEQGVKKHAIGPLLKEYENDSLPNKCCKIDKKTTKFTNTAPSPFIKEML